MGKATFDDIAVTTATQTEDEVRARLEPEKVAEPSGETAAGAKVAAGEKKPDASAVTVTPEQEADSERPDDSVSEAARTLRSNRMSERKTRLRDDIALYEDNVRRSGGVVPAFVPRTYNKPQDELDHLSRYRHELTVALNKALRERPAVEPAKPAAATPAAPAAAATEKKAFTFPTWDEYQEKNPEADYTHYLDARNDAREAWKVEAARAEEAARSETTRQAEQERTEREEWTAFNAAVEKFKTEHADYDTVTSSFSYPPDTPASLLKSFQALVRRMGGDAPKLLYYLGQHHDDATAIFQARHMAELLQTFGGVQYAALKASGMSSTAAAAATAATTEGAPAAAAAAAPAAVVAAPVKSPTPSAPAPLSEVKGVATDTRTLQQIAEDSEDADAYIERRKAEIKRAGGRP